MKKDVTLAGTAIISLQEIASYRIGYLERDGMNYADSVEQTKDFIDYLVDASEQAVSDPHLIWAYDLDMANLGLKIRRWFDSKSGYLCYFDDSGAEIEILYFSHTRQDYREALYRLFTVYSYVPWLMPEN